MLDLLESKKETGTQKEFWDIFRKISPKSKKEPVQPSMKKFFEHFQDLSKTKRAQTIPPISFVRGPLDCEKRTRNLREETTIGKSQRA